MDSTMADKSLNLNLNINPQDNNDETTGSFVDEELNRMSAENKKLTEMLCFLHENYKSLQGQLVDLMHKSSENGEPKLKKRKSEDENYGGAIANNGNHETCSNSDGGSWKRPREIGNTVSRVCVKTDPSDTSLIVRDGYQWRKYGQKVTRDNPSPRAYYKCSFAPTCPVKKKVQRSVEDPWVVVAIYEGEHSHPDPTQPHVSLGFNQGHKIPGSISGPNATISSSQSPILDSTQSESGSDAEKSNPRIDMPAFQELLVEKLANSLTRNHNFTTAVAAAISTKILDHDLSESWETTS
ncbi:WRKY transcription factor 40 [Actinidia chinensis var. chinensis]|uniref:WRKY transcription factor 40 n=1 Tax=Actinidia chinensis var. chinensis TaxID=1590841 RepID=A0A2R6Q2Y9_ACTCC|nr:WRKY transcription factor 40 [Actinidia chinensis var. chinensis]